MTEWLFAYGTLREAQIQRALLGRLLTGHADSLAGYRLGSIELGQTRYPLIEPQNDSTVTGLALPIRPEDLPILDAYETDAYRRICVQLVSGRQAWVYVAGRFG